MIALTYYNTLIYYLPCPKSDLLGGSSHDHQQPPLKSTGQSSAKCPIQTAMENGYTKKHQYTMVLPWYYHGITMAYPNFQTLIFVKFIVNCLNIPVVSPPLCRIQAEPLKKLLSRLPPLDQRIPPSLVSSGKPWNSKHKTIGGSHHLTVNAHWDFAGD